MLQKSVVGNEEKNRNECCIESATTGAGFKRRALSIGKVGKGRVKECFDHRRGTGGEFGDVVLGWRDMRALLFLRRMAWAIRESSARDLGPRQEGRQMADRSIWQVQRPSRGRMSSVSGATAILYLTLSSFPTALRIVTGSQQQTDRKNTFRQGGPADLNIYSVG